MLTISTEKKRFVMKEDEETCERLFSKIIRGLIEAEENVTQDMKVTSTEEDNRQVQIQTKRIEPRFSGKSREYRGFLYIKCPQCGYEKGQCSRNGMNSIHCDKCGCNDEFSEPLVPMYVNCECGEEFRYMTNMNADVFDMTCINCGSPVPMKYNEKKNFYETIRPED